MAKDSTAELRSLLRSAARKPPARGESLYSKVRSLYPEILELKKNGYTDSEIHQMFLSKGEKVSLGTLRQYIQRASKEAANEFRTEGKRTATMVSRTADMNGNVGGNGMLRPSEALGQSPIKSMEGRKVLSHKLGDDDV
ncbi:hypothetical protein BB934_40955 (plasmid) [Microvirga ossetica]|uniref:Uncharacterized protein n=1 Tax=Microvirga ossetica TaxID=1882682 RepID=A0A1B2EX63_9HYPH|nr:hypothetical protein [Microvirga ossetica]ANY84559.1 hypothetical protein BB934_40955 [Microvirga ossetica]